MVNRVILIGNLGKDPEVKRLENGAMVAKFSVATNENYKDKSGEWQQQTEWHDIVVWRTLAERAESTLNKGATIYIEGKLTHRKWQDQDGNNRKTTEVVASYFRKLNTSSGGNTSMSNDSSSGYFPSASDSPVSSGNGNGNANTAADYSVSSETAEADDDLPF